VTYCLALRLHEGLVFLADTRTNAGVDNIGSYRKLHLIQPAPGKLFIIESAGSLATTQEVLDRIKRDLGADVGESLATVNHLFEAALYLGRLSREVAEEHARPWPKWAPMARPPSSLGARWVASRPTSSWCIPRAITSGLR